MDEIFLIVFALIVAFSLGEMTISYLWLPAYFRYSLPLFRKEYPLTTMPDLAAQIPELEQKLKRSGGRSSIVFRALDTHEIAFRNKFGTRDGMSGLIRLEPNRGRMRISGNLYWSILLMPFMVFALASSSSFPIFFAIFILAIFSMTFVRQRYQYKKIAAVIMATAVTAPPATPKTTQFDAQSYDPVLYDPHANKPKSGMTNVELTLIIVLMAVVTMAVVVGILLFS